MTAKVVIWGQAAVERVSPPPASSWASRAFSGREDSGRSGPGDRVTFEVEEKYMDVTHAYSESMSDLELGRRLWAYAVDIERVPSEEVAQALGQRARELVVGNTYHLVPMIPTTVPAGRTACISVVPQHRGRLLGVVFPRSLRHVVVTDLQVGNMTVMLCPGEIPSELLHERAERFHVASFDPCQPLTVTVRVTADTEISGAFIVAPRDYNLEQSNRQIAELRRELEIANGRIADLVSRVLPPVSREPA